MIFWKDYEGHETEIINHKKQLIDNTIYTFDIETSSYIILDNKQLVPLDYLKLSEDEKERAITQSLCYIWQFSINDKVYYGRTLEDFKLFLDRLEFFSGTSKKIIYVHNLSYEFTYLRNILDFKSVFARKSRKVMKACLLDYNIEFRCSLYLSQVKLERLTKTYKLNVEKLVGNLNYNIPRSPKTYLTEKELAYCENDCLVLYEYIKLMKSKYQNIQNIPLTSTGIVRRELKEKLNKDTKYKYKVKNCLNTEGEIYDVLVSSFFRRIHARKFYTYRRYNRKCYKLRFLLIISICTLYRKVSNVKI